MARAETEKGLSFLARLATCHLQNKHQVAGLALAEFDRLAASSI